MNELKNSSPSIEAMYKQRWEPRQLPDSFFLFFSSPLLYYTKMLNFEWKIYSTVKISPEASSVPAKV